MSKFDVKFQVFETYHGFKLKVKDASLNLTDFLSKLIHITAGTYPSKFMQIFSQSLSVVYITCFNTAPFVLKFSLKQSMSLPSVDFSVGSDVEFVGWSALSVLTGGLVTVRIKKGLTDHELNHVSYSANGSRKVEREFLTL